MRRLLALWRSFKQARADNALALDYLSDILDSLQGIETLLTEIRDHPESAR